MVGVELQGSVVALIEVDAVDAVDFRNGTLVLRIQYWVCLLNPPLLSPWLILERVEEAGSFIHAVEDEMLCSSTMPDKVPYFNAPIYLQNKAVIGKVDEILGPLNEVYFSVKMNEGIVANSFKNGDKVYIGGDKLLPIERFLPKPKLAGGQYSAFTIFKCRDAIHP